VTLSSRVHADGAETAFNLGCLRFCQNKEVARQGEEGKKVGGFLMLVLQGLQSLNSTKVRGIEDNAQGQKGTNLAMADSRKSENQIAHFQKGLLRRTTEGEQRKTSTSQ